MPVRFISGHNKRKDFPGFRLDDRGWRTPCWIWTGAESNGYGRLATGEGAHVFMFRVWRGEVPAERVLHHECEQTQCVNPHHLVPISRAEHARIHERKLTVDQVAEIRRAEGKYREVAARFGVTKDYVGRIKRREART